MILLCDGAYQTNTCLTRLLLKERIAFSHILPEPPTPSNLIRAGFPHSLTGSQSCPFAPSASPSPSPPSLPPGPKGAGSIRIADNTELPQLRWSSHATTPKDPLGFPWHADLAALAASAASTDCPLCKLAQTGVEIWIGHYCEAEKNNRLFREFHSERVPEGQQLWLTRRFFGGGIRSVLPSRVLDIGTGADHDNTLIKLIDCTSPTGLRGHYACLSYCWGSTTTMTTTRESYSSRTSGIPLSDLPATFRDAIVVARKLRIRYLWIDSLCIFQDDQEDWARESSRMAAVYSGARVVIAENRARDSQMGIFHVREGGLERPGAEIVIPNFGTEGEEGGERGGAQLLYPGDERPWVDGFNASEPLAERGWALQERVLARRVLHFNNRQMYFECDDGCVGEDGFREEKRYCDIYGSELEPGSDSVSEKGERRGEYNAGVGGRGAGGREGRGSGQRSRGDIWYELLSAYGGRKLTKETDKLPAMSGLANLMEKRYGAKYVAGLWSNSLIEGLAWQGLGDRAPASRSEYIGPSWSWAGYRGIAATGLREGWRDVAEVQHWHVRVKNERNPYGEVADAWIRIRGPMADLQPSVKEDPTDHEVRLEKAGLTPLPRMCTKYVDPEDEEGTVVVPDHQEDGMMNGWNNEGLKVLILGGYLEEDDRRKQDIGRQKDGNIEENEKSSEEQKKVAGEASVEDKLFRSLYGLVLLNAQTNDQEPRMKRVGWMYVKGAEGAKLIADKDTWKTVTLV
ncbi:hypothetical protein DL764_004346 [Monosporascus ibericus]|uniref:Heterokaryon incompatibility domain-containing protein n=1 Tax=Monosporascus ibericus TaxID=155417 RepID=A0A4V1XB09_9PEZI|nr:hypothetical protein DL764_004346 [Monosporascus ibericus]